MYTHIFYTHTHTHTHMCIIVFKPVAQMVKTTCNVGVPGLIPGIGRSPRLPTPDMKQRLNNSSKKTKETETLV